ncbi:uncharacterized protein OCT59_026823 [Rhizophagus irregularis]|uniref:Cdc15p n=3 Tax=Rhizophagus irregularis TaxID=588596 RepID=A0A015JPM5_RHIIW|nr:Cdc15p [Rhizophagus irregularis DAOM 197198w]EXX56954.1 Cdc15p [Rhizophagus irregularis DAOM 197198w]UZO06504.1 hypothetical protein OCT59_026823 [Rhizophagus irregularis]
MLNTRNLNNREFKRIGSRIMAKVYFNKFITLKEIVKEIIEVNFCKNITHFYGTIRVMEYADSGTLSVQLTWKDKINMAFQLAHVVLSLHDEGIVHRDLHSNILMLSHQKNIKLANLGSSRMIVECPHGYFPIVWVYYYGKYLVDIPRFIQNQETFVLKL